MQLASRSAGLPNTRVGRRRFLALTGGLAGLVLVSQVPAGQAYRTSAQQPVTDYPFKLGIASGDPWPDSVVLWTRLAPDPLNGGGLAPQPFPVQWLVATDAAMRHIIQRGTVVTLPEEAHSVHVEVFGLEPGREYFYQFKAGPDVSPVGRTKTAPAFGTPLGHFTFAFASCQNYSNGHYPAHRYLAREDLDLVIHLGDYIYEGPGEGGVRPHAPAKEITTLEEYRTRHAQYKTDPDLQAAHAAFPWVVTWDDHEVENNYADEDSDPETDPPTFLLRRAAAYQAYWEHMPLRKNTRPVGPDLPLYRRLIFGDLMAVHVLDTRQYRSDQPEPCPTEQRDPSGYCPEALDPSRTILGQTQLAWLLEGLDRSGRRWNVLAQQVPFAPLDQDDDPTQRSFGGDKWDGYVADRQRILDVIQARQPANPVVITGDVHTNQVRNVPPNFTDFDAPPVATEFIGTSISSGGDPDQVRTSYGGDPNNPHRKFLNNNRGYVRCTVTRDLWQSDYRIVPTVRDPNAPVSTLATFVVEQGRAGAQPG